MRIVKSVVKFGCESKEKDVDEGDPEEEMTPAWSNAALASKWRFSTARGVLGLIGRGRERRVGIGVVVEFLSTVVRFGVGAGIVVERGFHAWNSVCRWTS